MTRTADTGLPGPRPELPSFPPEDANLSDVVWTQPDLLAIPEGSEIRGFALYVGLSEQAAQAVGWDLAEVVGLLRAELLRLVPTAQTNAILALATPASGGRDLDVVRLALKEPNAVAAARQRREVDEFVTKPGVVIDLSRNRLTIDGALASLTFTETELLQILVRRRGQVVSRREIIERLTIAEPSSTVPSERAIDVQIRRLRSKLGRYDDIIGTVRGSGYRFTEREYASVLRSSTPSPDVF